MLSGQGGATANRITRVVETHCCNCVMRQPTRPFRRAWAATFRAPLHAVLGMVAGGWAMGGRAAAGMASPGRAGRGRAGGERETGGRCSRALAKVVMSKRSSGELQSERRAGGGGGGADQPWAGGAMLCAS